MAIRTRTLTFVHDSDSLLSNAGPCSLGSFGTEIELVACAVLEVEQCDGGIVGRQGQLLHRAQLIGVIDWRGGGGVAR